MNSEILFLMKLLLIIIGVILMVIIVSRLFSIINNKRKDVNFERKQEKIKRNKQNISNLNKRSGISGRISSSIFTETVDIEDIRENNNVEIEHSRLSSKDFNERN